MIGKREFGDYQTPLEFDAEKFFGIEINPDYCNLCAGINDKRIEIINANIFDFKLNTLPVSGDLLIIVYSFVRYKVVVSGFYKTPLFALIYSPSGKPVMTDDTTYFIGFESFTAAYTAMLLLNSSQVQKFLQAMIFSDAKRPYTKKILERIDFAKIVAAVQFDELKQIERRLNLNDCLTLNMLAEFVAAIKVDTLF